MKGVLSDIAEIIGWEAHASRKSEYEGDVWIEGESYDSEALAELLERNRDRLPRTAPIVYGDDQSERADPDVQKPEELGRKARVMTVIEWSVEDDEEVHGIERSSSRADPTVSIVVSETIEALKTHNRGKSTFGQYVRALHFTIHPPSDWVEKVSRERYAAARKERRAEERRARAAERVIREAEQRKAETMQQIQEAEQRLRAMQQQMLEMQQQMQAMQQQMRELEQKRAEAERLAKEAEERARREEKN
jgi:myosin heavy subunit